MPYDNDHQLEVNGKEIPYFVLDPQNLKVKLFRQRHALDIYTIVAVLRIFKYLCSVYL